MRKCRTIGTCSCRRRTRTSKPQEPWAPPDPICPPVSETNSILLHDLRMSLSHECFGVDPALGEHGLKVDLDGLEPGMGSWSLSPRWCDGLDR